MKVFDDTFRQVMREAGFGLTSPSPENENPDYDKDSDTCCGFDEEKLKEIGINTDPKDTSLNDIRTAVRKSFVDSGGNVISSVSSEVASAFVVDIINNGLDEARKRLEKSFYILDGSVPANYHKEVREEKAEKGKKAPDKKPIDGLQHLDKVIESLNRKHGLNWKKPLQEYYRSLILIASFESESKKEDFDGVECINKQIKKYF